MISALVLSNKEKLRPWIGWDDYLFAEIFCKTLQIEGSLKTWFVKYKTKESAQTLVFFGAHSTSECFSLQCTHDSIELFIFIEHFFISRLDCKHS